VDEENTVRELAMPGCARSLKDRLGGTYDELRRMMVKVAGEKVEQG
jgi:hypothetical protein